MSQESFRISATYIQALKWRGYGLAIIYVILLLAYLALDAWNDGRNPSTLALVFFSLLIIAGVPVILWLNSRHRKQLETTEVHLTVEGVANVSQASSENVNYEEVTAVKFYQDSSGRIKRIDLRSLKGLLMLTHLDGMNQLAGLLNNRLPNPAVVQVITRRLIMTEPNFAWGIAFLAIFALALSVERVIPDAAQGIGGFILLLTGLHQARTRPLMAGQSVKQRNERTLGEFMAMLLGVMYLIAGARFWIGPCSMTGRFLLGSGCTAVYEDVDTVAFTPAGAVLIEDVGNDIQVKVAPGWLWNKRTVLPQPERIDRFFLSPDVTFLAALTGESGGTQLHIWDLTREVEVLYIFTDRISWSPASVAFAPDSQSLAFATDDRIEVWRMTAGQQMAQFEGQGAVAFHPDGRSLAAFTPDNQVKWWRLADGTEAGSLTMPPGIDSLGEGLGLAFSPDGRWLAANSQEGMMVVWQIPAGTIHKVWQTTPATVPVTFSPDSTLLAAGVEVEDTDHFHEGYIQLWKVPDYEAWDRVTIGNALSQSDTDTISFSPDGRLLTLSNLSGVVLYNVEKLGP